MFQKILVPLDGSEIAECVLPHVQALAVSNKDISINFIYVVAPLDVAMIDAKYRKKIEAEAKKAASDYLKKLVARTSLKDNAVTNVVLGKVADTISDYAAKNKMDLIVMATHGRSGVQRWLYGSVADKVIHGAKTPVWLVKAASTHKAAYSLKRKLKILAPLDGSEVAEAALKYLKVLGKQFPANKQDIILARVCEIFSPPMGYPPPMSMSWEEYLGHEKKRCMSICRDYLSTVKDRLSKAGLKTRTAVPEGDPAETLIDYVNKHSIDLVVLSTHGRTGFSRWAFGSIAEKLLRGANCPVLLVRAK